MSWATHVEGTVGIKGTIVCYGPEGEVLKEIQFHTPEPLPVTIELPEEPQGDDQ
jgi:hypothetical protein